MKGSTATLLFVYNAQSGVVNAALDSLHKIVSPQTYDCKLCSLTFGNFTEKDLWKNFRTSQDVAMQFLHKDEFLKQYRSKWLPRYDFPIVLLIDASQNLMDVFITSKEFDSIVTTEGLIDVIKARLNAF